MQLYVVFGDGRVSILQTDWLPHSKIRCYAIQWEMQANGCKFYRIQRIYYERDPSLLTQGVGYLRFSVNVDWDVSLRVQVPSAPRELEADEVAATEVELDWRSPADHGGDSADEYKVEIYRKGCRRLAEDDILRTRCEAENLDACTRYSVRVAARNSAGWGPFSTAVSETTRRARPWQPGGCGRVRGSLCAQQAGGLFGIGVGFGKRFPAIRNSGDGCGSSR